MNKVHEIIDKLPVNDLDLYIELGHEAIKGGDVESCLSWYQKGLTKARELKNDTKVTEISSLIFTLL